MDLSSPISSVIPGVGGVVLQILARTDQPLTGSGIAKLAEGSSSRAGVTKALQSLVASGLVECRPAGRANLYTLNREHVAAESILALAELRSATIERMKRSVDRWKIEPVGVYLFGSAARGDGGVDSDIDVLVVRHARVDEDAWIHQTMELARLVTAWTGNQCEILEYTKAELTGLARRKDRLIRSLVRDSIALTGPKFGVLVHI